MVPAYSCHAYDKTSGGRFLVLYAPEGKENRYER